MIITIIGRILEENYGPDRNGPAAVKTGAQRSIPADERTDCAMFA